ncbi:hypothetical protein Vretimale_6632 [Volvox reticuliferus]|uniref:CID domain-containing protein n=1 Tax=Volvox reticuliferus TaxID=1737510 RepID=A0A8J4LLE4_9CHLO|nr:hypothetical protein Vretimale_6632 [Volvox reticuliferus]
MALSAFGQTFLDELGDLKTPDRRSIVTLKDLAFENPCEAGNVVRAIRQHIKQCPAAQRLPALYLVDCMLKTEPCPPVYAEQLNHSLLEIFVYVWDNSDAATRPALTKLCKLWRTVARLDQSVVQACETYMVPAGQASTSGGVVTVSGSLPPPAYRGYPVTQQPQPGLSAPYGRPPAAIGNGPAFGPRVLGPPVHMPQIAVPPASFPVAHQARPVFQPAPPPAVLVSMPAFIQAQQPQQPQMSYAATAPQQPLPFTVRPMAPMQFAPATAHAPIPLQGSLVPPAFLGMHAATVPVGQQIVAPASPQLAPHSPQQHQQPSARPRSTEFPGPRALQELDETAVQDLREASDRTRPGFLDASFLRNKRRAAQAAAGPSSRQWYPSVDLWLVGTTSATVDNTDSNAEGESTGNEADKLHFVEEDPSQPECAISGEAFERFYDPDSDKWCYKDAVLLTGEEAAKYNVMDGSIVKVQCLAGAPSKLQMATLRAATASVAVANDLRLATAQPSSGAGSSGGGSSGGAASSPPSTSFPQAPQPYSAAAQQVLAPVATTAHLAQPMRVKEELFPGGPTGVLGAAAASDAHMRKRHTVPGDTGPGMAGVAGFPEAKRVKLEVQ